MPDRVNPGDDEWEGTLPVAKVHRISAAAPNDVSGIEEAIADGRIDPAGIVAILGKTEGNGNVNDFTRGFATQSLTLMLEKHLGARAKDVCLVMSGGTEGAMAPHWVVFERAEGAGQGPALAIGRAHTPEVTSEQIGRLAQADIVAAGVRAAMADAQIANPADVHFVQIKCPLLTQQRVGEAESRGKTVATHDTLRSMGLSRAASSLGVAIALSEIDSSDFSDPDIGANFSLFSGRASASAGIELMNHEIIVLGMSASWSGPLAIDHAVMADAIDVAPVRDAMSRTRGDLVAMLAKAEASHDGKLRGYRHTMLDDSDISSTRHARAFVAGALAGLVGHAEIYVSGGAEHQGPDGGGPVAIIVERKQA
jgi:cyanuric acid amidohydrolase